MTDRRPLLLLLLLALAACGGIEGPPPEPAPENFVAPSGDDLHAPLTAVLAAVVDDQGMVDYAKLKANPKDLLTYLETLSFTDPATLADDQQKLAYWINAYNAYTLKLILDHYPLESIRDIPAAQRWKAVIHPCGGKNYSLDQIEHEILRVEFVEPRIHFAVNCASLSCPLLLGEAYLPSKLDAQLAQQTRLFLADDYRGMTVKDKTLEVSKLFTWFKKDFVKNHKDVRAFILAHADEATQAKVKAAGDNPSITFKDYSWKLNGK